MNVCRLWSIIIALLLFTAVPAGYAMKQAATPAEIDLQVTGDTVKQWRTRASFPESITFAWYHVYMAAALEQEISKDVQQKIVEYIVSCQQPDGGFTPAPQHARTPSVIYTWYALKTLDMLQQKKAIDSKSAVRFLLARVQPDGGIVATAKEGEKANLATSYYGIESLHLLGAFESLDKTKTASFILQYYEKGRGFARIQNGVSIPKATFMAIRSLDILGKLTPEISKGAVDYLKSTRYSGLPTDKQYRLRPDIESLAYTLQGLAALSAIQQADKMKVQELLRALYIPVNGGFGPTLGLGTTPPATYHGIVSLVQLGELFDPMIAKQASARSEKSSRK